MLAEVRFFASRSRNSGYILILIHDVHRLARSQTVCYDSSRRGVRGRFVDVAPYREELEYGWKWGCGL